MEDIDGVYRYGDGKVVLKVLIVCVRALKVYLKVAGTVVKPKPGKFGAITWYVVARRV